MKLLFDFFPVIFFFIGYKFFGIYAATLIAIIASGLQVGFFWFKNRRFEFIHIITFALILLLGGATLFLHNEIFIKWKPTAIYWVLAALFFTSQFIGKKSLIQHMLDAKIDLPKQAWRRLNLSWIIFFLMVGLANLWVVYNCSTNFWVNFKLFGVLGMTLIFGILQSLYVAKYLENNTKSEEDNL
jgi:intracellular septation protein